MQVVSARAAAQQLRRYRQRIVSRLRSLKAKLTFPQQLSHSRNLRGILRESILKYGNVLIHERRFLHCLIRRNTALYLRHRRPYRRTTRNQSGNFGSEQLHRIRRVNVGCQ